MRKKKLSELICDGQLDIRYVPLGQIGPASQAQQRTAKVRRHLKRPLQKVGLLAAEEVGRQMIKHPVGVVELKGKAGRDQARYQPIFNVDTLALVIDYRAARPGLAHMLNTLPVVVVKGMTQTQEVEWACSDLCGDYLVKGTKTGYLIQLVRTGNYLKSRISKIIDGSTVKDLFRVVGSSPTQIWSIEKKIEDEKKKRRAKRARDNKNKPAPSKQQGAGYDARRIAEKKVHDEEG